ncbi:MAG: phosphate signaling complex protein PhoU [Fimbriimonadaceae bacterium]|nr:phosphate signaling complex protein PhoU [Chitinophagales bacterium]
MSQIDNPVQNLKHDLEDMFQLVTTQLTKAKEALTKFDKDLAREVVQMEKRVNGRELHIDRAAENFIALYAPVAIDLRFVLAVLKINNNLERIGDIAEGITKYIIEKKELFDAKLMEESNILPMYEAAVKMLTDAKTAFEKEDTLIARKIFKSDEYLDHINIEAIRTITDGLKNDPARIEDALYIISVIRKLERIGDQVKNIAEEIIFYIEAKVLKHAERK